MAVLEYYAFEARNRKEHAAKNFRLLACSTIRSSIYTQLGYDPRNHIPAAWKQFQDRVSLAYNKAPSGYSIFKEVAGIIVCLIQQGCNVGPNFVPDGSVGVHWSKYWKSHRLNEKYGEAVKYEHNFPETFPQPSSNPQPACAYPHSALGEFRNG
jgi:hypothetical protein